jgi:3-hydroxyacyl-CoA dehydrogenase
MPQQNAALHLVDEKIVTVEEIDLACEKALGLPLGPFRLLDMIGLDTAKAIRDGLIEHYPDLDAKPSKTLDELVKQGHYGQKSGQGFYNYRKPKL